MSTETQRLIETGALTRSVGVERIVMCDCKHCRNYDEFFDDNCGGHGIQECIKQTTVDRPKDTSEAYRKMVLMQERIDTLESMCMRALSE